MSKSFLRLAILSAPLVLTACGEGWEAQKTDTYFPYGNQRTAGSGVAYVLAKMMPKKEMVLEPVMEKVEAEPETVEPVLEAEEIFSDAQKKGSAPVKKVEPKEIEEKHSSIVEPPLGTVVVEESFASFESLENAVEPASGAEITAEDYIAQAPKRIIAKKIEVIKTSSKATESRGLNTTGMDDSDFESEEIVEVFENEFIQPQKEIIVPKKDPSGFLSVGQETLDQIYNNDF